MSVAVHQRIRNDAETARNMWVHACDSGSSQYVKDVHAVIRDIISLHATWESAYIAAFIASESPATKAKAFTCWLEAGMPDEGAS